MYIYPPHKMLILIIFRKLILTLNEVNKYIIYKVFKVEYFYDIIIL